MLFKLKIKLPHEPMITISVFERGFSPPNHTRLDVEVIQEDRRIFERGALYCGIPGNKSIDGNYAKKCVLELVAMRPGDTDGDYFDDYTEAQLEWAEYYGELLMLESLRRYGEEYR